MKKNLIGLTTILLAISFSCSAQANLNEKNKVFNKKIQHKTIPELVVYVKEVKAPSKLHNVKFLAAKNTKKTKQSVLKTNVKRTQTAKFMVVSVDANKPNNRVFAHTNIKY